MASLAVVALGGNAITRSGQRGTYAEQAENARAMAATVCRMREAGWTVVVVHGNGPQVGNLAVQQEHGSRAVPELPLFLLGAMTEGQLGSLLALALRQAGGGSSKVASLVTHVVVDEGDPAFARPTKPIGPFLTEQDAHRQAARHGWIVGEDAGRGYRRLVASPRPLEIVELDEVRALVDRGVTVVAAGGGGVPVVRDGPGYRGVDAVIDKDLAAQQLASALGAEALVLITDVPRVMRDYGTARASAIGEITVDQAQAYADDQQFPEGSMGPKVRASIQFIRSGGRLAVITNAELAVASLQPDPESGAESGTRIVSADLPASLSQGAAT
jgi:carbamate kinase